MLNPVTQEYVSSKPPLLSTLVAGLYWLLKHLFGWSLSETSGRLCPSVPPSALADYRDMVARTVAGESIEGMVRIRRRKDGRNIEVSINAAPLRNAADEITGCLVLMENMTERMRAQEQMATQLEELRRWQVTMLGREERNQELKREVNELSRRLGLPIPYPSQGS